MILCCDNTTLNFSISDISDIANIVIATVSLLLAGYIFIYQRGKDKTDKAELQQKDNAARIEALNLQEQNIRLQWFKELIVQPHLAEINTFYSELHSIETKLSVPTISDDLKIEVSEFVKGEGVKLRKSFGDILRSVNPQLHADVKSNFDTLIDSITNKIFDAGLNLNDKPTFEREIGSIISYSHNDLISKIYNYKGI
jgi:hypothetical protein